MEDPFLQEFVRLLGRHYIVMVGAPGVERPAILVPARLMEVPCGSRRQVRATRGTVVQSWYVQHHNQMRWAFAEEDAGNSCWLLFHLWSEKENHWEDYMLFWTLRQPRRGHRVMALHGRRVSVSYSLGLEGQLVLVVEEGRDVLWWVFYLEGPDHHLIHMISIQMDTRPPEEGEMIDLPAEVAL
jgi:hypothetical protein